MQVVERDYEVSEVAERLGISAKSLHTWKAQFAKSPRARSEVAEQAAEIKRLKRELARVTDERTILKDRSGLGARLCAVETACASVAL
ncbi:transposase [Thalassobacter stenotrophicus]|uniref:transposase n=1 Tax=Thalassobacter stenotrophicus TaxID=266809 RepID=UPI0022A9ADF8|nr:transposase [Thalassobacter stenotrophicus]UYP69743.1 transposase [Thalassobacter stenotrophicus]